MVKILFIEGTPQLWIFTSEQRKIHGRWLIDGRVFGKLGMMYWE
jgi:hypothetical protein